MSGVAVTAAGLLVLAAVLLVARPGPRRRLTCLAATPRVVRFWTARGRRAAGRAVDARGTGGYSGADRSAGPGQVIGAVDRSMLVRGAAPILVGLAVAVLSGGWWGLLAGALAALGVRCVVRRMPSSAISRQRDAAAAELPYAVDLLAAVLKSGAPLDRALAVVGGAVGGPLGERFARVGRALRLGVAGEPGWRALEDVVGAERLVPAAIRAADSGAALAAACARCAADLREGREARAEAAAQQAGVWVVLPLGFCFLPAFVLVGVVPIVLGVLDELLA